MILLDNINSDEESEIYQSDGGTAIFILRGDDFTGVTVTLNLISSNDSAQRPEALEVFDGQVNRRIDFLPVGCLIQVTTDGVGAGDNIFAEILQ